MASKGREEVGILGLLRLPVSSDILKYLCSLVLPRGCKVLPAVDTLASVRYK
jgi:hypothetical protein